MTKVLSGLYVGALENTKNEEELMANGISHILVVQNEKYEIEKVSNGLIVLLYTLIIVCLMGGRYQI